MKCYLSWKSDNSNDSPQIMLRVWSLNHTSRLRTAGPFSNFSSPTILSHCSKMTSKYFFKMLKWKAGVRIFRLVCHFLPSLKLKFSINDCKKFDFLIVACIAIYLNLSKDLLLAKPWEYHKFGFSWSSSNSSWLSMVD